MTSTEPLSTLAESAIWDLSSVTVNRAAHVEMAQHKTIYELRNGTLAFDVTADSVDGLQGLISKDHDMFGDGGHLTIWLDDGEIVVRLQSDDSSYTINGGTLKAGVTQSVAVTFGGDGFKLYVGGELVDSNNYTGGLEGNSEAIVIGASQWSSTAGTTDDLVNVFKGTLSDIGLYDNALSAAEIAYLADPDSETATPTLAAFQAQTTSADIDLSVDDSGRKRVDLSDYFDTRKLSLDGAPSFAFINANGNLVVDPGIGDAGNYDFIISDDDGNEVEISLVVEDTSDGETETPVEEPTPPVEEPTTPTTETTDLDVSVDDSGRKRVNLSEYFDTSKLSLDGAPSFASINANGNLVVDPGIGDAGNYDFIISDDDGNELEISLVVEDTSDGETETPVEEPTPPAEPENSAPTIAQSFGTYSIDEGESNRVTLANYFSDADGDALTMTLSGAPSWATVNANGKLILSPKDGDDGSYTFNITASDGESTSNALSATIKVNDTITNSGSDPAYTPGEYTLSAAPGIVDGSTGTQLWGEGVTMTGYALNGSAGTVVYSTEFQDDGFGVAGRGSRWDGQIDYYDTNGGQSEKLVIDFNGDVEDVILKVAMLGWREGPGKTDESGIWTALDEDGNVVGTGLIGPDFSTLGLDKKESGSYGIYPIEIDPGVAFDSLVLEATQFDYGDGVSDTTSYSYGENSSDFAVSSLEFTRIEAVDDLFF